MIVRIVRMVFHQEALAEFEQMFDEVKNDIRNFPGCTHLEIHEDVADPKIRYTYSHWDSNQALETYRESELFKNVWPRTKALFSARPQAFSMRKLELIG